MLRSLHIENIAVIKSVDIDFSEGFCALTGETGAGKSILIDSINLLLGGRFSKELIRTGENIASVSAVFDIREDTARAISELGICSGEEREIMLQRTVSFDGRSSAKINGRGVTVSMLRDIGSMLVVIHGQNDNQQLMQKSAQLSSLDEYASNADILAEYKAVYAEWKRTEEKIASLQRDESERLRLREMLEFQIKDIDGAKLKSGEEERLTEQRDRLLNREMIDKSVRLACRALTDGEKLNAKELVERAMSAAERLAETNMFPECESLIERLGEVAAEIEDISERIRDMAADDDIGDGDVTALLDKLEGRLDTISRLGRKYGEGIDAILAFRENAAERLDEIDSADERIEEYEEELKKYTETLREISHRLSKKRVDAACELSAKIKQSLEYLDMPKVEFKVSVKPLAGFGQDGADDVEFMISTNPGEPLLPMTKIASGGELARIMLALRSVLNDRHGVEASIYDEVDTGISGRTSRKVGFKLREIGRGDYSQVICVTHSAQIASLADAHYVIEKREEEGRASTSVRLLDDGERVEEIARILGGIDVTDIQRNAAAELINEK